MEKLHAVLNNSPLTNIRLVAREVVEPIWDLAKKYPTLDIQERAFESQDLDTCDIAIVAVNDIDLSKHIREEAKQKGILVNVADKPELCDFYLSSIVKKGNLKLAISTNGKSPTVAKRLKETFNDVIPEEID